MPADERAERRDAPRAPAGRDRRRRRVEPSTSRYIDGEPVGFGRAVFAPAAALLLGGAVLPEARGRGVYTSLVHARWHETVERGVAAHGRLRGPDVGADPRAARLRGGSDEVRLLRDRL